jgi:hypothetical protein
MSHYGPPKGPVYPPQYGKNLLDYQTYPKTSQDQSTTTSLDFSIILTSNCPLCAHTQDVRFPITSIDARGSLVIDDGCWPITCTKCNHPYYPPHQMQRQYLLSDAGLSEQLSQFIADISNLRDDVQNITQAIKNLADYVRTVQDERLDSIETKVDNVMKGFNVLA